ncbi:hypothetical protein PF008_g29108 [Phytophthora fragariae]|uniref:Uncharacterized protein n=1 Tax=Phytophthora fragariae TaxID=53985 RepID=A0A6G0Q9E2_9STRA|nr:hypothetical protein PF008_g29108 [Phytophthora fragariae]
MHVCIKRGWLLLQAAGVDTPLNLVVDSVCCNNQYCYKRIERSPRFAKNVYLRVTYR